MHIKVRSYIRVLGFLLSFLGYFANYLTITSEDSLNYSEIFWLIFTTFHFLPLILSSSILGRVPYFISKNIPKEFEKSTLNAEKNFTEFSFESVTGAIIALTIAFLSMHFQGLFQ